MKLLAGRTNSSDRELHTRYDCLEWLGSGGMSEVFLGIQRGTEGFNRPVVIKRMLAHPTGTENVDTYKILMREASYVANLSHPHIVKVFDLVTRDRNLVITMEYVEGETLRSIISSLIKAKKKVPLPILCRLISDAAEALHYVHTAPGVDGAPLGLVHHDIDTNNLMVETSGHIKLIDFGLANTSRRPDRTFSNIFGGKFTFAAPELFSQPDQADPRSDIYSLGIVLYIMATLSKPFRFGNESIEARMHRVIAEPLPVPSSIDPDIPSELDAIIASATHKRPDKRFQSAEHFFDAVEWLANQNGGMATPQDVRRWLFEVCGDKIVERREWVRRSIGKACLEAADSVELSGVSLISNPPAAKPACDPIKEVDITIDLDQSHTPTEPDKIVDRKTRLGAIGAWLSGIRKRRLA